jgi:hypothetical protein
MADAGNVAGEGQPSSTEADAAAQGLQQEDAEQGAQGGRFFQSPHEHTEAQALHNAQHSLSTALTPTHP